LQMPSEMNSEERISRPASAVDVPLIVAVACFAGDIAAPSELVSALPANCAAAFIFVQQLSAGRGILLAESLAKRTSLPVIHAHDGLVAEHGRLYVIPPNSTPTMTGGRICVTPTASGIDSPADALFTSLAQEFGGNAIGVILSGGGSDRAPGIRAIRQAGGITFAQYPGSARFPNIPISAIDTGCVDFVLRPNEIAHELARIMELTQEARVRFLHRRIAPASRGFQTRPVEDRELAAAVVDQLALAQRGGGSSNAGTANPQHVGHEFMSNVELIGMGPIAGHQ
jgi:two-component system CheB/CheR fusion protein